MQDEMLLMLQRCRCILNNMAWGNEKWPERLYNRWPVSHEPLRADAKNVLPELDALIRKYAQVNEPRFIEPLKTEGASPKPKLGFIW